MPGPTQVIMQPCIGPRIHLAPQSMAFSVPIGIAVSSPQPQLALGIWNSLSSIFFLFRDPFHMPVLSLDTSSLEHMARQFQKPGLGSMGKKVVMSR